MNSQKKPSFKEKIDQLEKELLAKNRELEIEAALEKVRSRSLAMHKSEELRDVVAIVCEKLQELNFAMSNSAAIIITFIKDSKDHIQWISDTIQTFASSFKVPYSEHSLPTDIFNAKESGVDFFSKVYPFEEKNTYFKYLFENADDYKVLPDEVKELLLQSKDYGMSIAFQKNSAILIPSNTGKLVTENEKQILKRFAKVFEQSYIRFLDLQKAEAQAREAQIELSIERVRAKAMAMQKSDDLADAANLLFQQVQALGVPSWSCGFNIWEEQEKCFTAWMSSEGILQPPFKILLSEVSTFNRFYESRQKGEVFYVEEMGGDALVAQYEYMRSLPGFGEILDDFLKSGFTLPTFQINHVVNFTQGNLIFITSVPVPEAFDIFKRFAIVFEQTYTRFLDLQKAEAQAREAQIQLAMERVRARTMAMQKSDELADVAGLLFKQVSELGIKTWTTGFNIWSDDNNAYEDWITDAGGGFIEPYVIDATSFSEFKKLSDAKKSGTGFFILYQEGEILKETYKQLDRFANKKQFEKLLESGFQFPLSQYVHLVFGSKVSLMFITYEPVPEAHDIFKRFGKVFEQTYTRFLDLQRAEAQAREATIETALEKIRSRSLAMHHSDELKDVIAIIFEKLNELNILLGTVAIWLFNKATKDSIFWVGNNLQQPSLINLPYDEELMKEDTNYKDSWRAFLSGESYINKEYSEEEKNRYFRYVFAHNDLTAIPPEARGFITKAQKYIACLLVEKNSSLYFDCWQGAIYSEESIQAFRRVAKVFEQAYIRFLDLQKAEAQAREAHIEAALERVRSRSMAMHKSDEVMDVAVTVYDELQKLDFKFGAATIIIMDEKTGNMEHWLAGFIQKNHVESYQVNNSEHPLHVAQLAAWREGAKFASIEMSGPALKSYAKEMFMQSGYKNLPDEEKAMLLANEHAVFNMAYISHGALMWAPSALSDDNAIILQRFAKVFEQTYTRFLDLQKAEAQAREAQIEAALERIRSSAMAMHSSDGILEVTHVLREQIALLGEKELESILVHIYYEDKDQFDSWYSYRHPGSSKVEIKNGKQILDWSKTERARKDKEKYHEKESDYTIVADRKMLNEWYEYLYKLVPEVVELNNKGEILVPEVLYYNYSKISGGALLLITNSEPSQESKYLLKRAAKVFNLAYSRFLDLQKAEAQAREAKIEVALERVRAQAMAMHTSEELLNVCEVMYKELKALGFEEIRNAMIHTFNDKNEFLLDYDFSGFVGGRISKIPTKGIPVVESYLKGIKKSTDAFLEVVFAGEELQSWRDTRKATGQLEDPRLETANTLYYYYYSIGVGDIGISTFSAISKGKMLVLERFRNVFKLSYQRYHDIEKAEAQAWEAKIEAALERVRSRTLAMQKSDELAEASAVLFKQLIGLGIEPHRLYFTIIKDNSGEAEFWITDEDGTKVSSAYAANLNDNKTFKKMLSGWQEKKKSLVIDMQGQELQDYYSHLASLKVPFKDGISHKRRIQHLAYFNKGFIGMASADEQPEETSHLLERFAAVFNLTFTRFNDLKIAEAHAIKAEEDLIKLQTEKKRAEDALSELQVTQKQLIQSEKMASLGELTAGIAHEIQNPLNFVNNFSEVSKELLDEMKAALANGDADAVEQIADDIIKNLEKINHHGKRADAIVKGMLQHSQASKGQKQFTDINALADEYLRLSYHGLRAKHKDFDATIKTNFDGALVKINIVPQDIGRVLLNLYNNAFYACAERSRSAVNDASAGSALNYQPTVSVSTKKINDKVEIKVIDNGSGIPQNIVEKVFQPFFTTKPTGQGTGLGLSLAYDIIKAHGGEIHVETKEGEGTQFIIKIPIMPI